jgi:hypothetical protein
MPEAATVQAPPDSPPGVSALDQIDALMSEARTRVDSPDYAAETPPPPTVEPVTPEPAAEEPPVTPADGLPPEAPETSEEAVSQPTDPPQKAPSRREAGRLQEQLLAADTTNRELREQLAARTAVDTQVRSKYGEKLGSPAEKAQLDATLANPNASFQDVDHARGRLAEMKTANDELAPIYQSIEQDVFASFSRGINELRTLDGMDEQSHAALFKATSGVQAMRQMYDIGRKAATADAAGEIKGLKASLSELRTKQTAHGSQPAGGSGTNAPSSSMAGMIGADGLPTDEAIERAKNGGLRSLGAS